MMRGLGIGLGTVLSRAVAALVLIYEALSVAAFSRVNTTLANAGENDPESGTLAQSMKETVADSIHYIQTQTTLTLGRTYRLRVVVKADGRDAITLLANTLNKYWYGQIGGTTALLSSNTFNIQCVDLGGGWFAQSMDFTMNLATGIVTFRLGLSLVPVDTSYPGDITKGVLWGSVRIYEVP